MGCPNCGYCPHCGRGRWQYNRPYVPVAPVLPCAPVYPYYGVMHAVSHAKGIIGG